MAFIAFVPLAFVAFIDFIGFIAFIVFVDLGQHSGNDSFEREECTRTGIWQDSERKSGRWIELVPG